METILDALGRASWQGGIAIIAVLLLCRLFPRLPAAIRCALWRLAYVKLLLSLVLVGAVILPVLPPKPTVATPIVQKTLERDAPLPDTPPSVPIVTDSPPVQPFTSPPVSGSHFMLILYSLGLAVSVASLYGAWRRTRILIQEASPASDGSLSSFCAELAERLKLKRLPGLWTSDGIASPLVVGVVRESVLLPHTWVVTAATAEIRLALAHELAHIRRRDLAWEWLGTIVQILFFFHPLVWLARREERAAREMACDTIALSVTGEPASIYSRLLYQIATLPGGGRTISVGALGSGEKGRLLLMRITELGSKSPTRRYLWIGAFAAVCVLLVTGVPWQLTPQVRGEPPVQRERITGVVRTPDGEPAPGVTVSWVTTTPRVVQPGQMPPPIGSKVYATTTTDSQGRYHFDTRSDSPRRIVSGVARPTGIFMAQAEGWGLSFSAPLTSDSRVTSITLQPAIVYEVVCTDKQGKPLAQVPVEARELALQDEVIYLDDITGSQFRGKTDAQGRFRLRGLPNDRGSFGLIPRTRDWAMIAAWSERIAEGFRTYYILCRTGKITGTVQGMDKSIRDISVWYQRLGKMSVAGRVSTDSNGNYEITGLLPGSYRVWAKQANEEAVAEYYSAVPIKAGETVNRDFLMKPGLLLHGQVVDEKTKTPLPDVEVGVANINDSQSEPPYLTTTDAEGRYRLRIRGGGMRLIVRDGGKAPVGVQGYDEQKKMVLGETANVTEMTVDLAVQTMPKLTLQGSVVGPDGKALPNAIVEYWNEEMAGNIHVSSAGTFFASYSINRLRFPIFLRAHSGDLSAMVVIRHENPGPLNLRLAVHPRPVLTGWVVDRNSKPIVGAQVIVRKTPRQPAKPAFFDFKEGMTTTDAQGRFTWTCSSEFSYRVTILHKGKAHTIPEKGKAGFILVPEKVNPLEIVLP